MACERLTEGITIKGLIVEVFKWICIVHTFAASSRSNVRAMDLFENNLVSAFGHETRLMRKRAYLWPHLGECKMNDPANDIVTPCLVIVPVRFLR
jgi:hypothetical protein